MFRRLLVASIIAGAVGLLTISLASADPGGSKNSVSFSGSCVSVNGETTDVALVINNANGQGSGAEEQDTAPFAPAHVVGTNQIFHPAVFDLTFSFSFDGQTFSFHDTDAMQNPKTPWTCTFDNVTASTPQGETFTLDGTVRGFFS